jgi:hypothetical protein
MATEPTLSPKHGIQTAWGFTLVCMGLLMVVFAITYIAFLSVDHDPLSKTKPIATFTGKDNGTTGSFTVTDNWEFRWTHNGHLEQIIWKRADGFQSLIMEIQRKKIRQHGSLNFDKPGEYKFEVVGQGDWKIEVYQF